MCRASLGSGVVTLACVCIVALGCVPSLEGNEPKEPNKGVPASFGAQGDAGAPASPGPASSGQARWAEFFGSPELKSLIEGALGKNQELNIRLQEIIIARAEVSARRGEYLPRAAARAGAGFDKGSDNTSQGRADEANGLSAVLGDFSFGLTGSWEVDIWKKLRNAAKAADLRYLASVEARNFMVTQIVAELSRSYFELIAIDSQLDVLRRNIDIQVEALEVVRLQKQAGRVTELAVQKFEAEVLKNRSRVFELEQERVELENRINFLAGRYPQPVKRNAEEFKGPLPAAVRSGLPSQLLDNRPDVRQAELELEATKLDVKAAKAAFYPSLTIDAELGYRSFNLTHLLSTPASLAFGIVGGLMAPLLNRRGIEAQYRSANARQVQAVFSYEKTLLQAFTDVANQLAMIENLRKSYELQSKQVEALARSVDISNVLFQSARADYMEVLLTRRDSLDAELELVDTKKRQLLAIVNLYQALGGGWRSGT